MAGGHIAKATRTIEDALRESASTYLQLGLERFLNRSDRSPIRHQQPQVTIGLLGVGCELLLKAIVARACFAAIFSGVPQDIGLALALPERFAERRDIADRLLQGDPKVKTIEFAEALAAAKQLVPAITASLQSYLTQLPQLRNRAVHSALSPLEHHHVEWVAFAAIELHGVARKQGLWLAPLPDGVDAFIERFNAERAERVRKALDEARKRAKSPELEGDFSILLSPTETPRRVVSCVVCGSEGIMDGTIDRWDDATSGFFGEAFECEACELHLVGHQELHLAGFEIAHEAPEDREYEPDDP